MMAEKSLNVIEFNISAKKLLDIATKKIDKGQYIEAVGILKKAVNKDPDNMTALLELADVYSRLNMLDKSNSCAYKALCKDHNEESLYIIGNNFFKNGMYTIGIKYFDRLIEMYPRGKYYEYALNITERSDETGLLKREIHLMKLIQKGKTYIENEQYNKAIRLYGLLCKVTNNVSFMRNNLAMAYFYDGQVEKAIKICKEIIASNKYEAFANCNLALIYSKTKRKFELRKQMERLSKVALYTQEEYLKLLTTYCEIKSHENVVRIAKEAISIFSYNITYMILLAIGYYNMGKVNKSLDMFSNILKIDPENYEAYYYRKLINSIMKPKKIDYYSQLPIVAVIDTIREIREMSKMEDEELKKYFDREKLLMVVWGVRYQDYAVKKMSVNILGKIADYKCETILRDMLFDFNLSDRVKKDIFATLKLMGAKEPYYAYFAGDILDVNVSVSSIDDSKNLEKHQDAINIFVKTIEQEKSGIIMTSCIEFYVNLLNSGLISNFKSIKALCGTIEMIVCQEKDVEYSKTDIAKRYRTTSKTIDKYKAILESLLFDKENE